MLRGITLRGQILVRKRLLRKVWLRQVLLRLIFHADVGLQLLEPKGFSWLRLGAQK